MKTINFSRLLGFSLLIFLPIQQTFAQGWYNNDWHCRKELTIDYTKVGPTDAPHVNIPILVSLSSDSDLQDSARSDGFDILFTAGDGTTKLDHDRSSYASGNLTAWVEIPSLSASSNTIIYMYYGNSGASDQQNKTGTWNSNFKGVWHLDDDLLDFTSFDNDGTNQGTSDVAGKIDDGQNCRVGYVDYIDCGNNTSLRLTTRISISAWLKSTTNTGAYATGAVVRLDPSSPYYGYMLGLRGNIAYMHPGGILATNGLEGQTTINDGTWHYVVGSYDGTTTRLYVDGVLDTSRTSNNYLNAGTYPVYIGRGYDGSTNRNFPGDIDEVRISDTIQSPGWIQTEYNNQNSPATFYSVGTQVLPVSLLYFRADRIENNVMLTWATASETNNDYFTIEKSDDGRNYQSIGKVYGAGTSSQINQYTFTEANAMGRTIYYRLKQTDFDLKSTYSRVEVISTNKTANGIIEQVYPVPATGTLNVDIRATFPSTYNWEIFNMVGTLLSNQKFEINSGLNQLHLNIGDLSNGTYFLHIEGPFISEITRFTVAK